MKTFNEETFKEILGYLQRGDTEASIRLVAFLDELKANRACEYLLRAVEAHAERNLDHADLLDCLDSAVEMIRLGRREGKQGH